MRVATQNDRGRMTMSFEDEDFKMAAVKSHDSGTLSHAEALQALGVTAAADNETVRSAFRQRLKSAHPDINGGTDALLRRLILARDLLMSNDRITSEQTDILRNFEPDPAINLTLSIAEALKGGVVKCPVSAPVSGLVTVPPGVRDGEYLILTTADGANTLFCLTITPEDHCRLFGNDIWMSARIEAHVLKYGGTAIIETPHGAQIIRVEAGVTEGSSLHLKGRGLPAVRQHPAGDLHIRLEATVKQARAATEVLSEFRQRWAG